MDEALHTLARLFARYPRPVELTNKNHCPECAEHHQELAPHTPTTIRREHLGHPGWDPITFTTDEAFLYYLPGLARIAATARGDQYYLDQFLSHLRRRASLLTREERHALADLLRRLRTSLARDIELAGDEDELDAVVRLLAV